MGAKRTGMVLLAALLAAAGAAQGQGGARVMGRVTDGVGRPLAGVRVAVVQESAPSVRRTAVSGETGGFQVEGLPPGTYRLRVEGDTTAGAHEARVTVAEGERRSVVMRVRDALRRPARRPDAGEGRP